MSAKLHVVWSCKLPDFFFPFIWFTMKSGYSWAVECKRRSFQKTPQWRQAPWLCLTENIEQAFSPCLTLQLLSLYRKLVSEFTSYPCVYSTSCARWRKSSLALRESLTWWLTMPAPSATLIPWSRPMIRSRLTWRLAKSQNSSSLILVSAAILLLCKILFFSSRALRPAKTDRGSQWGHVIC